MNMERALTSDEKLRRAEEIYYRRRANTANQNNKTVSVPISNKKYLVKKMIIQIAICFIIYCSYYVIRNFNFIFSKEVIDKTNEVLSYDIDIQELYCKVANYINNYSNSNQESEKNDAQEVIGEDNNEKKNVEDVKETFDNIQNIEVDSVSSIDTNVDTQKVASTLSQMELDANEIKANYSLISPLKGQITYRFGAREQTQEIISPYHVGLDIAANTGTIIVSSMEGRVVASGEIGGYGQCVQIQKDDVLTIYGHCSKLYVNSGDPIVQGQQIAEVGETGNATGPHLHFEIRKSGRYVDPELIL